MEGLALVRRRPEDLPDDSPVVVLVHGAMDRAASFGRTMRRLGGLDVIAYDRRGYGDAVAAGVAPGLEAHAQDLATILEWSGAPTAVLVGHSLGGTIGAQLVATAPRTAAGSVVTEGGVTIRSLAVYESPFPALDGSFDSVGGGAVEIGRTEGPEAAAEHFYRSMVGERTWSRVRERDRAARRAEGPALLAELEDLRRPGSAVDPAAISVPVLVGLGGLSSQQFRRGSELFAEALHMHGVDHEVDVLAGIGHGAHLSHPGTFARFVRRAAEDVERWAGPQRG